MFRDDESFFSGNLSDVEPVGAEDRTQQAALFGRAHCRRKGAEAEDGRTSECGSSYKLSSTETM